MKCLYTAAALLPFCVSVAGAADHHHHGAAAPPMEAVCVMAPTKGNDMVGGTLSLTQHKGYVLVKGSVHGLTPGDHGFHIHMFGDLRDPAGMSAGGHFNPGGHKHGGPESAERHAGDLGNIRAGENGVAPVNIKAKGLELHYVIGRSMVVHAKADDLKSDPSGESGARIGVGVIGIAEQKPAKMPAKRG